MLVVFIYCAIVRGQSAKGGNDVALRLDDNQDTMEVGDEFVEVRRERSSEKQTCHVI